MSKDSFASHTAPAVLATDQKAGGSSPSGRTTAGKCNLATTQTASPHTRDTSPCLSLHPGPSTHAYGSGRRAKIGPEAASNTPDV